MYLHDDFLFFLLFFRKKEIFKNFVLYSLKKAMVYDDFFRENCCILSMEKFLNDVMNYVKNSILEALRKNHIKMKILFSQGYVSRYESNLL